MWKKVEYTRREINDAGKLIASKKLSEEERIQCLQIIDNWRAAHAFPMNTFAINLKHQVEGIQDAVVVQRLKRLDTIVGKLQRYPEMELYRMQDLGGCRVIVPTIEDVYQVVKQLKNSRIRHELCGAKDYIAIPKPDTGYRCYHLIYKYFSEKNDAYNGLRVEIQIRTKLQHLWATAVETVGLFTDNGLKFNQGSEKWLRFFKLVSALFSIEESSAIVEGVSTDSFTITKELVRLIRELDVIKKLGTIGVATNIIGHVSKNKKESSGYYLLTRDNSAHMLNVMVFPGIQKGFDAATQAYNDFEKTKKDPSSDAVLVSAQSYEALVYAYPNYFADITEFAERIINFAEKAIAERKGE